MARISEGDKKSFQYPDGLTDLNVPLSDGSHISVEEFASNGVVKDLSKFYDEENSCYKVVVTENSPTRIIDFRNVDEPVELVINGNSFNELTIYYRKGQLRYTEMVDVNYLNEENLTAEDLILSIQFNVGVYATIPSELKARENVNTIFDYYKFGKLTEQYGFVTYEPWNGYLIYEITRNGNKGIRKIFAPTIDDMLEAGYYPVQEVYEIGTDKIENDILYHYVLTPSKDEESDANLLASTPSVLSITDDETENDDEIENEELIEEDD